jgi:DNA-binding transcriptional MocR family regulator
MKEQTLVEMKNKVDALIRVLQEVMNEQQHLTVLASGMMQTIKLMPGYDDAIKQITEKAMEEVEKRKVDERSK